MTDAFDGADYYDCCDSQLLRHDSPSEAIEDMLDMWATPDCDMVALIEEHAPITVTAYHRSEITDAEWTAFALNAAAGILDSINEEYGDPDGGHELRETEESLGAALEPALRAWCKEHYQPWRCNPSGERVYEAAEVEALMRADNPHWFEP